MGHGSAQLPDHASLARYVSLALQIRSYARQLPAAWRRAGPSPWCGLLTFWVEPSKRRALIPCRPATVRSSRVAFHLIKPHQPGSWAWTFGIDARRRVLQARLWRPDLHVPCPGLPPYTRLPARTEARGLSLQHPARCQSALTTAAGAVVAVPIGAALLAG